MAIKKIIAHRGVQDLYRENTMGSFTRAIDIGADMIEFDIRRTSDNVLVAFHDKSITDDFKTFLLKDLTFKELCEIGKKNQIEIPEVRSIFETFTGQIGFDIEFKEDDCEEETFSYIDTCECGSDCWITSFNESIVRKVKLMRPHIPCGLLINSSLILRHCDILSLDMLAPSAEVFLSNRDRFTSWKSSLNQLAVWTVDDPEMLAQMFTDPLIDAIITNNSENALKMRSQLLKQS